jgi:sugar phosphate isomerase/epimerase
MTSASTSNRPLIGLAPLGFLDLAPAQLIRVAAEAGFNSVGLRTQAAVAGGIEYPLPERGGELEAIRTAMIDTGVVVDVIEVVSLHRHANIHGLAPMLRRARGIGVNRILCTGDDENLSVVADKFAELCDLACSLEMSVHLEFMRFREGVRALADAMWVLDKVDRPNGFLVIDVLHLMRSEGGLDSLRKSSLKRVGTVQLCDGPLLSPAEADLASEARHNRLPPGEGGFPIRELLDMLPPHITVDVEVPLSGERANWSHARRAALLHSAARSQLCR